MFRGAPGEHEDLIRFDGFVLTCHLGAGGNPDDVLPFKNTGFLFPRE